MRPLACNLFAAVTMLLHVTEPASAQRITRTQDGRIHVQPLPVPDSLRQDWPQEMEAAFWRRANHAIQQSAPKGGRYGTTYFESEKRSYPAAMYDLLAGNVEPAVAYLQEEDNLAADHAHTEGIDFYPCFTLKGQMRKYFFFGGYLDPAYRARMRRGAERWTAQDPHHRPHPKYGNGDGSGQGWMPQTRGGWVDGRNTDNLRAMRDTSVYLMAEETGNEATRLLYKQKIIDYVATLYRIGMGEWDSENYHGHALSSYLNLYDFAKDRQMQAVGKAALDWFSAAGAMKYRRGGFGGPTRRDYGRGNVVFGAGASHLLHLYFGDCPLDDPRHEPDEVHAITSAYRPPLAVVALARKQFDQPVEVFATKPFYENWKPGADERPEYYETQYFARSYQLGTAVAKDPGGLWGTGPFKLLTDNEQRGVDYFVAHSHPDLTRPNKHPGDQIAQYRNLAIWLRPAGNQRTPFIFQRPVTARVVDEGGVRFFALQRTWIAIRPIRLNAAEPHTPNNEQIARWYSDERFDLCSPADKGYYGFAIEAGEMESHGSFDDFRRSVLATPGLDLTQLEAGQVKLTGVDNATLELHHNADHDLPVVIRDGVKRQWDSQLAVYRTLGDRPLIEQAWKSGKLHVRAGGYAFETTVMPDGRVDSSQRRVD